MRDQAPRGSSNYYAPSSRAVVELQFRPWGDVAARGTALLDR